MQDKDTTRLSNLPSVSRILDSEAARPLLAAFGSDLVTELARAELERLRGCMLGGTDAVADTSMSIEAILTSIEATARRLTRPSPRPVINATGVVVHTNLGRATLSASAAEQVAAAAMGYLDLEYDIEAGRRGNRLAGLEPLMARMFPGSGFTVVNNNAAAVMLALRALSRGKEAIVSRGELVEIGGSFRIPDVMEASGARLREVGTTNRTRAADYEKACGPETGLILKVHTSNFKVVGFTEEAPLTSMAEVARAASVPLLVDWGSGDLVDMQPLGIRDELPIADVLSEGADVVTFSGDKLLGGPQAGFIVGDPELIARIKKDPLARVCRLDRLRLGALHRTLVSYVTGKAFEEVPTLAMLAADADAIGLRASRLREAIVKALPDVASRIDVVDGVSRTGGGSSPVGQRPTRLLSIADPSGDAAALERALRRLQMPIIGRMQEGCLLLDLRTVRECEESLLLDGLLEVLRR